MNGYKTIRRDTRDRTIYLTALMLSTDGYILSFVTGRKVFRSESSDGGRIPVSFLSEVQSTFHTQKY